MHACARADQELCVLSQLTLSVSIDLSKDYRRVDR